MLFMDNVPTCSKTSLEFEQESKMGCASLAEVTIVEWPKNEVYLGYIVDGDGAVRGLLFDLPMSAACTPAL